jgi:uncharacterized protein (TIGR03084 family)
VVDAGATGVAMTGIRALLADLGSEQRELRARVAGIAEDDWLRPTPARGWDVRDTIAHLADTDEMAIATATGAPGSINERAAGAASGEDVTYAGVLQGRRRRGAEVLAWWDATAAAEHAMFEALDPDLRVPWGIGMRTPSFVTARLMETWAHGLDVGAALGVEVHDTDRLAHVAWLATRALPYAYTLAGREPPSDPLRVELTLPSGAQWSFGPSDAADRITGAASDYCRVFVHRRKLADAPGLSAAGPTATAALAVARAFL